jgi:hypothetical protein
MYERFYYTLRYDEWGDRAILLHGLIHFDKTPVADETLIKRISVERFDYDRVDNKLLDIDGTMKYINADLSFAAEWNPSSNIVRLTPEMIRIHPEYPIGISDRDIATTLMLTNVTNPRRSPWVAADSTSFVESTKIKTFNWTIDAESAQCASLILKVELYGKLQKHFDVTYQLHDDLSSALVECDGGDVSFERNGDGGWVMSAAVATNPVIDQSGYAASMMRIAGIPGNESLLTDHNISTYTKTIGLSTAVSPDDADENEFQTYMALHSASGLLKTPLRKTPTDPAKSTAAMCFAKTQVLTCVNKYGDVRMINRESMFGGVSHHSDMEVDSIPGMAAFPITKDLDRTSCYMAMDALDLYFERSLSCARMTRTAPVNFNYSTMIADWRVSDDSAYAELSGFIFNVGIGDVLSISTSLDVHPFPTVRPPAEDFLNWNMLDKEIEAEDNDYPEESRRFRDYRVMELIQPGIMRIVPCGIDGSFSGASSTKSKCVVKLDNHVTKFMDLSIYNLLMSKIGTTNALNYSDEDALKNAVNSRKAEEWTEYIGFVDSILNPIETSNGASLKFSEAMSRIYLLKDSDENVKSIKKQLRKASKILRTIAVKASLIRGIMKYVAQKHAAIGAGLAVKTNLAEYILRVFTKKHDWMFDIESMSNLNESNEDSRKLEYDLPWLSEWSSLRHGMSADDEARRQNKIDEDFEIEITQFDDTTEYFNVSAKSAVKMSPTGEYETLLVGHRTSLDDGHNLKYTPVSEKIPIMAEAGPVIPETAVKNARYWIDSKRDGLSKETFAELYANAGMNIKRDGASTVENDSMFEDAALNLLTKDGGLFDTHAPSALMGKSESAKYYDAAADSVDNLTLDAMQDAYSAVGKPNGDVNRALNHKNTTYPTIASQPWIYNLVEHVMQDAYPHLRPTLLESNLQSFADLVTQIDRDDGLTIDSWRHNNQEFSGYQTFYEESRNMDYADVSDPDVDRDGPFKVAALNDLLNGVDMMNHYEIFFKSVKDPDKRKYVYEAYFKNKLDYGTKIDDKYIYVDEVFNLKDSIIHSYDYDMYGNQYMLYKKRADLNDSTNDDHGKSGELWVRLLNHPLPYKISNNTPNSQVNEADSSNNTILVELDMKHIYEFGVVNDILWVLTSNDNYENQLIEIYKIDFVYSDVSRGSSPDNFLLDLYSRSRVVLSTTKGALTTDAFHFMGCWVDDSDINFVMADMNTNRLIVEHVNLQNPSGITKQTQSFINLESKKSLLDSNKPPFDSSKVPNLILDDESLVWTDSADHFFSAYSVDGGDVEVVKIKKTNQMRFDVKIFSSFNMISE